MAVERIVVNGIDVEDSPGSLEKLLSQLASEGVDMRCAAGFSAGGGRGEVLVSAKDPDSLKAAAEKGNLQLSTMAGFLLSEDDAVGACSAAIKPLADAGVNVQAVTAVVCDGKYHLLIVVNTADADAAEKLLQ